MVSPACKMLEGGRRGACRPSSSLTGGLVVASLGKNQKSHGGVASGATLTQGRSTLSWLLGLCWANLEIDNTRKLWMRCVNQVVTLPRNPGGLVLYVVAAAGAEKVWSSIDQMNSSPKWEPRDFSNILWNGGYADVPVMYVTVVDMLPHPATGHSGASRGGPGFPSNYLIISLLRYGTCRVR
jgi:hypothetical protein